MPRISQQLHPHREPVTPLHAATVLLLRDAPAAGGGTALEVLMTRRSDKASFVPGAVKSSPCSSVWIRSISISSAPWLPITVSLVLS